MKVARYRDGLGLRADDAWIDEVERSVDEPNPIWQLKLSPEEAAALEGRRQVQRAADPLLASLSDDERSDLAGVWFAKEATGRLMMNFTRRVEERRQALQTRFAYPEKLTVGFAPYSLSQLDALMERIENAIDRDQVSVPFIVRRDIENRVDVEVFGDPDVVRSQLGKAIGPGPYRVVRTDRRAFTSHHTPTSEQSFSPPPIGGQRISRPASTAGWFTLCSSAFYGTRVGPVNQDVMITAGHCTSTASGASLSDTWSIGFPGVYQLGFTLNSSFVNNSDTDSAIIAIANGSALPDVTDTNFYHRAISSTGARGDSYDIVNANTCVRGVAGDGESPTTSCGLIDAVNVTVTYEEEEPFDETTLFRVRRATNGFGYRPGVSGGAVISQYEGGPTRPTWDDESECS